MKNPWESPQTPAPEQEKHPELLQKGAEVKVLRSSGETEEGWVIDRFDNKTGNAIARKQEGKEVLEKPIPQIELYALNKPSGESKKFTLDQWVELWNSTESSLTHKISAGPKIAGKTVGGERLMSPEEAREFLREQSREAMHKGMSRVSSGPGTRLSFDSGEERIQKLQRRIALFGGTSEERGELKYLLGENQE